MASSKYIIPIFVSHLGCPNDCVFCNQRKITGIDTELANSDVERILSEYFSTIPQEADDIEVAFYGGSFSGMEKTKQIELLLEVCKSPYRKRIRNIRISTRPDYINKDIIRLLKKYGVTIIELGVQSLVQDVLDRSKRGHRVEDVYNAVRLIEEEELILGLQMMIGLPGDNLIRVIETALGIASLNPDFARIYPTLVIKGTELELKYLRGDYLPLNLSDAIEYSKIALSIIEGEGIKVIRLGLQTTEGINIGRDVVGGPFHQAFRELVEGEIAFDLLMGHFSHQTDDYFDANNLVLQCNSRYVSIVVGHNKKNLNDIRKKYPDLQLKIVKDDGLEYGSILVKNDEIQSFIHRRDVMEDIRKKAIDYYNLNKIK